MPASTSRTLKAGLKVRLAADDGSGIGEVLAGPDRAGKVEVGFFTTPTRHVSRTVPVKKLVHAEPPAQTRAFYRDGKVWRHGRVIFREGAEKSPPFSYRVQFPGRGPGGKPDVRVLAETEFHVRCGLPGGDPTDTLADLAHETPFFFEHRAGWVREYLRQVRLAGGMTGVLSAAVDLFPHQMEVVRRVLQDPEIRYLLADEVGLGKTIEAGLILRQLRIDSPDTRISVFTPGPLVPQWEDELTRLELGDVEVQSHEELAARDVRESDVVVFDEAHRVVSDPELFEGAQIACRTIRHVLLLSATPVMHHEAEMLGLLHLLSPQAYRLEDLKAFRERVQLRRDLGRVLLALSTANTALTLRPLLRRAAELLPADPVVAAAKQAADTPGADVTRLKSEAATVLTHASEAYRLHRRMLRSRRAAMVAEGSIAAERKLHPVVVETDPRLPDLWAAVEEWRVALVGAVPEDAREKAAADYLRIATALAADREWCHELVEARLARKDTLKDERGPLARLRGLLAAKTAGITRIETLRRFLEGRTLSDTADRRKYVVFCDEPTVCERIARHCRQKSPSLGLAAAHGGMTGEDIRAAVRRFREVPDCRVLVADRTAEEGLNLTFAYRVVLYDLPVEPLRIEQRIGRLDRLTRQDDVHIHVLLSSADGNLALDAAWFRVLDVGFGLFSRSASDVQLAIDAQTNRLRLAALAGGPAALSREADGVGAAVGAERAEADEQDAIDGLHLGDATNSPAYRGVREADRAAADFGSALRGYWVDTLRLAVYPTERFNVVEYGSRGKHHPPLIPADRFAHFAQQVNRPATVSRAAALGNPGVPLIRPGHPFADALWELAEWDDRGRAFAMWREVPGQREPRFVFRVAVLTGLELPQLAASLHAAGYDELARANLLRLVGTWFPPRYDEVFLDEKGEPAQEKYAAYCREVYESGVDKNLGDDESPVLTKLVGAAKWPKLCAKARDAALEAVTRLPAFVADQEEGLRRAADHFRLTRTRLQVRAGHTPERAAAVKAAVKAEAALEETVTELIRSPRRRVDAIGFYVLSAKPPEPPAK